MQFSHGNLCKLRAVDHVKVFRFVFTFPLIIMSTLQRKVWSGARCEEANV